MNRKPLLQRANCSTVARPADNCGVGTGDAINASDPLNDTTLLKGPVMPFDTQDMPRHACGCNPHILDTRAARIAALQAYMRALGASVAAGEAMDELRHDHEAVASAGRQLLDLCGAVGVDAPMVLV